MNRLDMQARLCLKRRYMGTVYYQIKQGWVVRQDNRLECCSSVVILRENQGGEANSAPFYLYN